MHCDVSLDQKHGQPPNHHHAHPHNSGGHHHHDGGGDDKPTQPIQFSFTLYDLDGHGKITKDDVAGIVSTIYESLGKSVVVPHYGSKTINVRLTVSPDSSQPAKLADTSSTTKLLSKTPNKHTTMATPRRRYRARKLLSDDEGSDTSHDLNHNNCSPKAAKLKATKHHHHNKSAMAAAATATTAKSSPLKSPLKEFSMQAPVATVAPILNTPTTTDSVERNLINLKTPTNSVYMTLADVNYYHNGNSSIYEAIKPSMPTPDIMLSPAAAGPTCECNSTKRALLDEVPASLKHQQVLLQQREHRKKLMRKTRPRKQSNKVG